MNLTKKALCILLIMAIVLSGPCVYALDSAAIQPVLDDTAKYIYTTVSQPTLGSMGGEWAVFGLARSGYTIPDSYFADYYRRIEEYVISSNGVLNQRKFTEYARLIVALTSIGKDPTNVAGYNLLTPLGDYESTTRQGINGAIWALIALDCKGYQMPVNPSAKTQATRDMYIEYILSRQLDSGGFTLRFTGPDAQADVDVTAMVIQALSKHLYRSDIKDATDKALSCISAMQSENGGFSYLGIDNSESCIQAIVALCEMGISIDDPRFVKNGNTLWDNLLSYYSIGNGFSHNIGMQSNIMASEQGLYALAALERFANGKSSLYNMNDEHIGQTEPATELKEKQINMDLLVKIISQCLNYKSLFIQR
ncbi:MAG: terpene cyclase/mutase family protein [Eubacteriales bacterium]|nr:terpene cyclase/mutase family protein [Eubacteriales bacterium]